MNSVAIVTLNDLAKKVFEVESGKLNLKLSKAQDNGLTLKEDGLFYKGVVGSTTRRVLLGTHSQYNSGRRVNIDNDLTVTIMGGVNGLGLNVASPRTFRVCLFEHPDKFQSPWQEDPAKPIYATELTTIWEKGSYVLAYSVDGVNKTITLSHAKLGDNYYVWVDVIGVADVVIANVEV